MAQPKPAGLRSVWGAGMALGGVLLLVAWATWFSIHNLWEIPVGLYLFVICMGKVVAR